MTRESRARWLAFATALLVVALSALFAALRNLTPLPVPARPAPGPVAPAPPPTDAARIAAGRAAYARLDCALCHAIAAAGNPSYPLDRVGARRDRQALHDWTTGSGAAQARLGTSVAAIKARAADDPDLDALLDYLQQLR